ncbi:MAG: UTP--glucose-1-phosphate uridylyltransferase [Eubacteriales bacterium]
MVYEQAKAKLKEFGQEHLLAYYDELDEPGKVAICNQVEQLDFSLIQLALQQKEAGKGSISPLQATEIDEIKAKEDVYRNRGIKAIQEGKVAALMLAGGMGTRLGSNNPKGMYNIGLTRDCYIFECQIRNLLDVVEETGAWVPIYIMTSESNQEATMKFFKEQNYFGYQEESIIFFVQEMAPVTDFTGKVFLESKSRIASSPNGNGGWFASMANCNLLEGLYAKGVEWINVFAVDNVLQRIVDPCFVGATLESGCTVGAKVVRKNARDEKIGVLCLEDNRPSIVEYYELTDEMMDLADEKGDRIYNFGVILNYLFQVEELKNMLERQMPLHVVKKKIPYLNEAGESVKAMEENGCKYETLALDMIHLSKSCLPYEVDRVKEFAPIKNKEGVDSVESARELLQKNGVKL